MRQILLYFGAKSTHEDQKSFQFMWRNLICITSFILPMLKQPIVVYSCNVELRPPTDSSNPQTKDDWIRDGLNKTDSAILSTTNPTRTKPKTTNHLSYDTAQNSLHRKIPRIKKVT